MKRLSPAESIEQPTPVEPEHSHPARPRLIVDLDADQPPTDLVACLRQDYDVTVVDDREAILADPTLSSVFAIIITQRPSRLTVREFTDRLRRSLFRPPRLIAAGSKESPWLSFVEKQANVDGIICDEDPLDHQLGIFGLLVNQAVESRMAALGDRAVAIWDRAKGLIDNIEILARSGQPIPQSAVHGFAEVLVEDPDDALFVDIVAALRDHHTETLIHSLDMAIITLLLGRHVGVRGKGDHYRLFEAGLMHDIGKTEIPRTILDKPGKLDAEEMALIRRHPLASERILRESGGYDDLVIRAAAQHHEKNDGTGYPRSLTDSRISEIGHFLAVCDIYCALTERRAYKPRLAPIEAFRILRQSVGAHLDGVLVERLIEMISGHLGPRINDL